MKYRYVIKSLISKKEFDIFDIYDQKDTMLYRTFVKKSPNSAEVKYNKIYIIKIYKYIKYFKKFLLSKS